MCQISRKKHYVTLQWAIVWCVVLANTGIKRGQGRNTGTRNAILAEPATTAVYDNIGIDVPIIYR